MLQTYKSMKVLEFKIDEAREIWRKLIAQGWRRAKLFEEGTSI